MNVIQPSFSALETLITRLHDRTATIGIVGLGYVGQPLALRYAEIGYKVVGFDISQGLVAKLNGGQSPIEHIDDTRIAEALAEGFEATTDFARIAEADGIMLCVPTPLNKYREPDLSFVIDTVEQIAPYLREGQVVALESTTYPGTTKEEIVPRLERGGLTVGKNVFAVYSPSARIRLTPNSQPAPFPRWSAATRPPVSRRARHYTSMQLTHWCR